ncbi:phosphoglycerate kinase, partial [bacterium]|nr:phosphoglycerate kinase [bacterium]
AKIADKIPMIENLIKKVDRLLIGGGMSYTFFKAQGKEIGNSMLDEASLDFASQILKNKGNKIGLPVDCLVTDSFDFKARKIGQTKVVSVDNISKGWQGLDVGPKTIEFFSQVCRDAKTIVWNGPLGVFEIEATAKGTMAIAQVLAEVTNKGAVTIIGGGDSASAVKKAGLTSKMSHVSTGGGASLEFLQGEQLPGVTILTDAKE